MTCNKTFKFTDLKSRLLQTHTSTASTIPIFTSFPDTCSFLICLLLQMLRRQPVPVWIQRRGQNLYKPGDGLKTVSEVLSPKPVDNQPVTWETHTLFGTKRETNLFHYSDRKAGAGYSNFRVQPYPHRPFVFPVAKKPARNILILLAITMLLGLLDHDW